VVPWEPELKKPKDKKEWKKGKEKIKETKERKKGKECLLLIKDCNTYS
jgi:hypothetical protein